jgi:tape measure domain-containing protein
MSEVIINFKTVGDEDTLSAIKTVQRNVASLKKIAKTDLSMKGVADSMSGESLAKLQEVVNKAKMATMSITDLGKAYSKTGDAMKGSISGGIDSIQAACDRAAKSAAKNLAALNAASAFGSGRASGGWADAISAKTASMPQFGPTREDMYAGKRQQFVEAANRTPDVNRGMHMGIEYEKPSKRIASPLMNMDDGGAKSTADFAKQFAKGAKDVDGMNAALRRNKDHAAQASYQMGLFARILAGMFIRSAVRGALEYADAFTNLQNKIRSVTEGPGSLGIVTKQMFEIASASRTSVEAITTMFSRTTRAVKGLGLSQKEVLQFTETLSKAIVIGGSSAVEASNAMIQLSQGMGSGALRGDELRSVLEQLPIVASLIAEQMKRPVSELRKLGAEGKITTEVIVAAVNSATEEMNEKFRTMPLTFSQAMQGLKNKAIQKSEELGGVMSSLADMIQGVTNNFDGFATAAASLGILLGEAGLIKVVIGLTATFKGLGIAIKSSMGWIGAIIAGLSMVTIALAPVISKLKLGEESAVTFGELLGGMWDEFVGGAQKADDQLEAVNTKTAQISDNFKFMVRWAAQVGDLIMRWLNPLSYLFFAIDKIAGETTMSLAEYQQQFSDMADRAIRRTESYAYEAQTDRMLQEEQEAYEEDLQWDKPKKTKGTDLGKDKKESGKTFQEIMVEAEIEANKWMEGRFDGKKKTLENRVFDQSLDAFKELSKSEQQRVLANKGMVEELQNAIRVKEQWKDVYELIEVVEKSAQEAIKAEWDNFAKELEELIKKTEEAKKAVVEFQEAKADRESSRYDKFNDIAGSLDPNMAINSQIADLEKFQKFAKTNGLPAWAEASRVKIEELKRSMHWSNGPFEEFANQMNGTFGPGGTLVKGFADVSANAIVASQSMREFGNALRDLMTSIQKQALSSLIQLPMNLGIAALTGAAMGPGPAAGASALPTGGTTTSWSGAENMPANWGKFSSGGYTGSMGVNDAAGIVHGQEYVLNAEATRRIGKENLDIINKGGPRANRAVSSVAATPTAPIINIHNNAPVQVSTSVSPSTGEIEVMINQAINQRAPGVIAKQLSDPNSNVSRSLSRNTSSERRRT